MGSGKHRWKVSFYRSSPRSQAQKKTPREFVCPISGHLMFDPVIVSSGQTFERNCIKACKDLGFIPRLGDGSRPDVSSLIPNIALKSIILHWCDDSGVERPKPLEPEAAKELVRTLMVESGVEREMKVEITESDNGESKKEEVTESPEAKRGGKVEIGASEKELLEGVAENPPKNLSYAATEVNRRPKHFYSSSEESVAMTPLPLATKPSCYSSSPSSSSSEIIEESLTLGSESTQETEIIDKMKSSQVCEQEEAVISLRKITRNNPESRFPLCTPRLLVALRSLLFSRYSQIQINAVAALVNLSLEKPNKVKIVRAGTVPPLIDVLKGGFPEAQEHAAGAIFSLALEDENKTAIGVLGALPPLLRMLRSESERARQDAALALYHLSLVQSNRSKLVKLGSIPTFLSIATSGELQSRILIILCNLASSTEGRAALLDAHAVEVFVEMLKRGGQAGAVREACVAALYAMSQSGMRFKGSAKAAGAAEVLKEVAERGSERAKEKAKRMLMLLKGTGDRGRRDELVEEAEEEQEGDLDSIVPFQSRRYGRGKGVSGANSTEF